MSWEDMGLYWAWRSSKPSLAQPPTKKEIIYASVFYDGKFHQNIACGILNDGVRTDVCVDEIKRLKDFGFTVETK